MISDTQSTGSDDNSTVTSEIEYSEEDIKKGEAFKVEGNELFASKYIGLLIVDRRKVRESIGSLL